MNPIITSLPGMSQAPGVQSRGGGTGDHPSFAAVLPAYTAQGPQPGEPVDAQTGKVAVPYGQAQEAKLLPPQQQLQMVPDSEEAMDSDLMTALPCTSEQGQIVNGTEIDGWAGETPLSPAGTLTQDSQQAVSAPLKGAAQPLLSNQDSQRLNQVVPQGGVSAPEVVVKPARQMSISPAQGALSTGPVGTSLAEPLGAWRPLTGGAVTQVPATELPAQLADGERRPADTAASVMTQISSGRSSQWGPVPLDASAGPQSLGRQMLAPLKEQVRFSLDHGISKAEVRLDPPDLGRIDLSVRHEGDRVTVQLTAANPAVREALALGAERLRSEMTQGLGGEVQVDVGQGAPQQKQQQPEYPGRGAPLMAALDPAMEQPATERDLIDMLA